MQSVNKPTTEVTDHESAPGVTITFPGTTDQLTLTVNAARLLVTLPFTATDAPMVAGHLARSADLCADLRIDSKELSRAVRELRDHVRVRACNLECQRAYALVLTGDADKDVFTRRLAELFWSELQQRGLL